MNRFVFAAGVAAIHRGTVAHSAHPITHGERTNAVLWLYGDQGRMPPRKAPPVVLAPEERWTTPTVHPDSFAPSEAYPPATNAC